MPYKVTDLCILCGACVVGCESSAITEGETQAHINVNLCVECGTCERNCPSEAIIFVEEDQDKPIKIQTMNEEHISTQQSHSDLILSLHDGTETRLCNAAIDQGETK